MRPVPINALVLTGQLPGSRKFGNYHQRLLGSSSTSRCHSVLWSASGKLIGRRTLEQHPSPLGGSCSRSHRYDLVPTILSIPALFIGHSFGIIPAPGSFASSAFPVPPKKSSEASSKISCAPPKKQTLALGAASSRFRVPQLQGQKRRNKMYQNRVHLIG